MFELKLYLNDINTEFKILNHVTSDLVLSKELNKLREDLDLYEIVYGDLQIFKIFSENISLTDSNELFRFLPIQRNILILVIAIPEHMNEEDFISFIDKFLSRIIYIRFIYHSDNNIHEHILNNKNGFMSCLIYFDDQNAADNFFYEYNNKNYPTDKFEFMYCIFIDKLNAYLKDDFLEIKNINEIVNIDYSNKRFQLCLCPLCLEKLDTSSSGIHTIINLMQVERWENYKKSCKVCSKFVFLEYIKCEDSNCRYNLNNNSDKLNSMWCCLICGYTGCDRYQKGHAKDHFDSTLHRYSIDLKSQRIWDYIGDNWVHRMVQQGDTLNTICLENNNQQENINSKEFVMRIENIISEYNFVLNSQLEEQRKYYEKEIFKINEKNDIVIKNKTNNLILLREEIDKKKNLIENYKKLSKECNKKVINQERKINELKENINLNNELSHSVRKDLNNDNKIIDEEYLSQSKKELLKNKMERKQELERKLTELYETLSNKK